MNKIEIITPVHIGTGEKIEAPCFHKENDFISNRYLFTDILSQMPASVLTDSNFLNNLASKQSNKYELYKNINRYVNYDKLKKLYSVKNNNEISESGYDVYEQVKDLDKPYIPGSSLKGALLNAWFYYILKANFDKLNIEANIKRIFSSNKSDKFTIVDYLYNSKSNHADFITSLQSCLVCRDVYFDKMEILWAERLGSGKDMNGLAIPISYRECIQPGQFVSSEFMYIDEYKKSLISKRIDSYISNGLSSQEKNNIKNIYENILSVFKQTTFYKACRVFTRDVLEEDCTSKYNDMYRYYNCLDACSQAKKLLGEINTTIQNKENVTYLRIGNSTNYFSKTITLLIRNKARYLYDDYFDMVLSPNSSPKSKTRANKNSNPKTRTVYSSLDKNYLPGFIKIYYD